VAATESTKGAIPETIIEGTNDSSTHTLGVEYTYVGKGGWGADGTGSITDSSTVSGGVALGPVRSSLVEADGA
jgi:hypothetical protein